MSSSFNDGVLFPALAQRLRARMAASPAELPLTDEELLLRTEAGDCSAVALLFDRFADLVLGIGLKLLRDRGEAEDLVQDVFLYLFEKVRGFDPGKGAGRTWVIQIAYRRAFDRRKYLARRRFYAGTDADFTRNTQEEPVVEDRLYDRLTGEQLHKAFEDLTEEQRTTLEMYFFEGYELREISDRLGDTLDNVRHYYYRGLERLRRTVFADAGQDRR